VLALAGCTAPLDPIGAPSSTPSATPGATPSASPTLSYEEQVDYEMTVTRIVLDATELRFVNGDGGQIGLWNLYGTGQVDLVVGVISRLLDVEPVVSRFESGGDLLPATDYVWGGVLTLADLDADVTTTVPDYFLRADAPSIAGFPITTNGGIAVGMTLDEAMATEPKKVGSYVEGVLEIETLIISDTERIGVALLLDGPVDVGTSVVTSVLAPYPIG
jgi:hypothetical protein